MFAIKFFKLKISNFNLKCNRLVRNLNPFLMPIFWIEVEANVKTEAKKELAKLSNIYDMIPIVHIIALCIGLFMSLISIIGLVYNYFKSVTNKFLSLFTS